MFTERYMQTDLSLRTTRIFQSIPDLSVLQAKRCHLVYSILSIELVHIKHTS